MSTTVDNRVVEMRFDNKHFENNVRTSMSTLEKLKQSLNLKGATKGLEDVSAAAKNNNMHVLGSAVESVQAKFSALQIMGVTALANITNSAVNTGKRMIKALTLDPIMTGFSEYETQIGAIQTILANTQSKGSTLTDVNRALDELNTYADKTIYNFTEMTRNIGTFTAAGVDLDMSVAAIKGIANLAAVSGSTSQQASTAMYQLSQALAAGRVSLMDWNSVVNAGMGGELFQNALKRTATNMGTDVDAIIEKYGSFRESLTQGEWLTTEVLTETLKQLSGAYTEADLIAQGYTEEQARQITQLAETAVSAATEVKTFTQLWDTLKEAAQSGWTQTWEILIGDFEEAKQLLTSISDAVGGMLNSTAEARNKVLREGLSTGWKQLLDQGISDEEFFKDITMQVAKDHGIAIDEMIESSGSFTKSLKEGWLTSDILSESIETMTGKINGMSEEERKSAGYTEEHVKALNELNDGIKNGSVNIDEYVEKIQRMSGRENVIQGLTNVFQHLLNLLKPIKDAFSEVFPAITGEQIYAITERFKAFTETLTPSAEIMDKIKRTAKGVFSAFDLIRKAIVAVLDPLVKLATGEGIGGLASFLLEITASIGDFFTTLNSAAGTGNFFSGITEAFSTMAGGISNILKALFGDIEGFGGMFSALGDLIGNIAGMIGDALGGVFGWIKENIGIGSIFAGLAGGGIFMAAKSLSGLFSGVSDLLSGGILGMIFGGKDEDKKGIKDNICEVLDSVRESLTAFTSSIKATTLLTIAVAIGILAASLNTLSKLEPGDIALSLGAIAALMVMLNLGFKSIITTLNVFEAGGIIRAGISLVLMATAINILAGALKKIAELSLQDLVKGLIGTGVGLGILCKALGSISGKTVPIRTSIAILVLAEACKILGDALAKFGEMTWGEIARGLTAMGVALAELSAVLWAMSKFGGAGSLMGSIGLVIAVQALDEISSALKRLGSMSWGEIGRGLTTMAGALAIFTAAIGVLGKIGGFSSLLGGTAILIAAQALDDIGRALRNIGKLSWDHIARGLTGMGGALAELSATVGILGKFTGFSGILGAGAIVLVVEALDEIGSALRNIGKLPWDHIARGLVGMGGALAEVAVAAGVMGKIAPVSGLLGAGTIVLVVQALDEIAAALRNIGKLSWDHIARGLVGMGAALGEVATITGLLGRLTGLSGLLGAGALVLAVQSLGDLADAFKKFGEMTWDQIKMGLVGMGGALTEVSVITGVLGSVAGLPALLGGGSLLLAVQSLGDLADAFKKFGEMDWDQVKNALAAMGGAMGETALGGLLNTFSGLGALSIAAIAKPLGDLADSVKKWANVNVPQGLGGQLSILAAGVMSFNFAGWGAWAITEMAESLGVLAGSVKAWAKVTVPEGIDEQLKNLASGVSAFNFAGWGASAIAELADPLGSLAGSVRSWATVTVPEGLKDGLIGLADGVKAWSWAFMGGWSIDAVVEPLKNLAGSVAAWNNVSVPEGIKSRLEELADGIKAWTWAFMGGWSIGAVVEPLKSLADAVKAWNGVAIPDSVRTELEELASGIKAWSDVSIKEGLSESLKSLADGVKAWNGVSLQDGFGNNLKSIAIAINNFNGVNTNNLSAACESIGAIGKSIGDISNVDFTGVTSKLTGFASAINSISISADTFTTLGNSIVNNLVGALTNGFGRVQATMASLAITFQTSGLRIVTSFAKGVSSGSSLAKVAVANMATSAASAATSSNVSFYNAGYNCASGFANGIAFGSYLSTLRARAMAKAAVRAANAELQINSPSKVFMKTGMSVPEGMAKGIDKYGYFVTNSVTNMATGALDNTKSVISRIGDAISHVDMDAQPTIRPVVDLSDVESGTAAISSMFNDDFAIGAKMNLNAISTSMRRRNQNGANDDVVSAINSLRKDVGNLENNSYSLGNITFSAGDEVAQALNVLVNAARVEGRV